MQYISQNPPEKMIGISINESRVGCKLNSRKCSGKTMRYHMLRSVRNYDVVWKKLGDSRLRLSLRLASDEGFSTSVDQFIFSAPLPCAALMIANKPQPQTRLGD